MSKKYLWIGMFASDDKFQKMAHKGYAQSSAQTSQKNLITGLEFNLKTGIDTLNAFVLPSYPQYQEKRIKSYSWSHKEGATDFSVGFYNVKYYCHISRTMNLKKAARQWANRNKENEVVVFVYMMHSPFMNAANEIKKIVPSGKIFLIVTDLPQYMDLDMNVIKKCLKIIDWQVIKKLERCIDGYILYTKHMAEFLHLADKKWIVMEGTINENDIVDAFIVNSEKETVSIMYSGVIDKRYGIVELLEAFSRIEDSNYELWLTGSGNAVSFVEENAKIDNRINTFWILTISRRCFAEATTGDDAYKHKITFRRCLFILLPFQNTGVYGLR